MASFDYAKDEKYWKAVSYSAELYSSNKILIYVTNYITDMN